MPGDLHLKLFDLSEIWQHLGSIAADVPVKLQSDAMIQITNLMAPVLYEICR